MPQAGFEPAIPASEWPQTHILERAATWIGTFAMSWNDTLDSTQQVNEAGGGSSDIVFDASYLNCNVVA
jgi:hypothetical protein